MLKDLIVNLSAGDQRDVAADFAISVAEKFEAHVTGIAYRFRIELPGTILGTGVSASIVEAQAEATNKQIAEILARFERAAKRAGVSFDTMSPDLTLAGASEGFGRAARTYDLAVVRQPQPDKPGPEELIAEGALFGGARPTLIVPYVQKDGLKLDRVTVCWDGGRAASRAVADALPFLARAKKVEVLIVQKKDAPADELPGATMAQHLARHKLDVELRTMLVPELDVASAILSHVADNQTDLLVMGGYGHSRLREFVLGGVTRNILASMTVPTLMSH
jgi:nucleotide-binding universal stress UspA family protein